MRRSDRSSTHEASRRVGIPRCADCARNDRSGREGGERSLCAAIACERRDPHPWSLSLGQGRGAIKEDAIVARRGFTEQANRFAEIPSCARNDEKRCGGWDRSEASLGRCARPLQRSDRSSTHEASRRAGILRCADFARNDRSGREGGERSLCAAIACERRDPHPWSLSLGGRGAIKEDAVVARRGFTEQANRFA